MTTDLTTEDLPSPPGRALAQRDADIVRRRAAGETLQAIAHRHGLTRERVRQLVHRAGGPSNADVQRQRRVAQHVADERLQAQLRELMAAEPGLTLTTLAGRVGRPAPDVRRLLGADVALLVQEHAGAPRQYTDQQISAALRRASATATGERLSASRYDRVAATVGGPTSVRVIQRFGTWRAACEAAGVEPGTTPRRTYRRAWSEADLVDWVERYLSEPGSAGSYAGFQTWCRCQHGAPSAQTVRNQLGSWVTVKRLALSLRQSRHCGSVA